MMILKILLLMECCGLGDHISALPAISTLAQKHEVTVVARKYYNNLFRDVTFIQAAGQDEFLAARSDKTYWLAEWSSIEEMKVGYMPVSRMEQFANLTNTELPGTFDYSDYLKPRKVPSHPYIVFCSSAVEDWRSLPEEQEAQLYARLTKHAAVVQLPRVNIYRNGIQPVQSDGKFIACDLRSLIDLIYNAHAVVSVDSGPLHLACALGIPSVGIFGVTGPEVMEQYRRYNPGMKFIGIQGTPAQCAMPCYRNNQNGFDAICYGHRESAYCMEHINLNHITNALEEIL